MSSWLSSSSSCSVIFRSGTREMSLLESTVPVMARSQQRCEWGAKTSRLATDRISDCSNPIRPHAGCHT